MQASPAPRRVLPILVLAQFLGTSPWFAVNAVMPDLQRAFGWPASAVGTLTSAVQFGFIAGALVFALLAIADRFPPRRVFLLCAVCGAACTVAATAMASSFGALVVWRALTGFFLAGIYPVGMKIASQWFPRGLGAAMGLLIGALVLGSALPHALRALSAGWPWAVVFEARRAGLGPGGRPAGVGGARPACGRGAAARAAPGRAGQPGDRPQGARVGVRLLRPHVGALHDVGAGAIRAGHPAVGPPPCPGPPSCVLGAGALGCAGGGWLALRVGSARVAGGQLATSGLCCARRALDAAAPSTPLFYRLARCCGASRWRATRRSSRP